MHIAAHLHRRGVGVPVVGTATRGERLDAVNDAQEERAEGRNGAEDNESADFDNGPDHEEALGICDGVSASRNRLGERDERLTGEVHGSVHPVQEAVAYERGGAGDDADAHKDAEADLGTAGGLKVPDERHGIQGEENVGEATDH